MGNPISETRHIFSNSLGLCDVRAGLKIQAKRVAIFSGLWPIRNIASRPWGKFDKMTFDSIFEGPIALPLMKGVPFTVAYLGLSWFHSSDFSKFWQSENTF